MLGTAESLNLEELRGFSTAIGGVSEEGRGRGSCVSKSGCVLSVFSAPLQSILVLLSLSAVCFLTRWTEPMYCCSVTTYRSTVAHMHARTDRQTAA